PTTTLCSFTHANPTAIYTLSLHDALPISGNRVVPKSCSAVKQGIGLNVPMWAVQNTMLKIDMNIAFRRPSSGNDAPAELNQSLLDRKSTRLNSSHVKISYAVFCLKKIRSF